MYSDVIMWNVLHFELNCIFGLKHEKTSNLTHSSAFQSLLNVTKVGNLYDYHCLVCLVFNSNV